MSRGNAFNPKLELPQMKTQKKKNSDQRKKRGTRRYLLWLVLALVITFALIAVINWWRYGTIDWRNIGVMIAIVLFFVVMAVFPEFTGQLMSVIGERRSIRRPSYRLIIPIPFVIPFVFYLLLSGVQKSVPPTLQWSIIAVAPILGGLVLAGASNRRIKKGAHDELISVAQKLIVATVFFILFTCFFFTVEITGGIDTSLVDLSLMGWFRGVSFWISAAFFYAGVYLFLVAIIDLVLVLKRLRA